VDCIATVGQVGNLDHENETYGKAGRTRWHGISDRSRRGMNPVDHPHGVVKARSRAIIRRRLGLSDPRQEDAAEQAHG